MADIPPPPPGFVPDQAELGFAKTTSAAPSSSMPPPPPGFVPDTEPDANAPGKLASFGRGALHGATFGYEDKLGFSKEADEAARRANPWTHFFGEAVGAIAPAAAATLLPEVAAPLAGAAATGRVVPWAARGYGLARGALTAGDISTLPRAIGQASKLGATYGALAGSGNAPVDPTDTLGQALEKRLAGAGEGAAEGAVTGPVLGAAGHGLFRSGQLIGGLGAQAASEVDPVAGQGALKTMVKGFERDRMSPQELIDEIVKDFPDDSLSAPGGMARRFWNPIDDKRPWTKGMVEDVVRQAMAGNRAPAISRSFQSRPGEFGLTPGEYPKQTAVQSLLDELAARHLGPVNIVDRAGMLRRGAGKNTQMTMRAAFATPGDAATQAAENLTERQIGAGGRMGDLFASVIGNPDFDAVAGQHTATLDDAGQRAYATAFNNEKPFDLQPIFDKYMAAHDNKTGPVNTGMSEALSGMMTKVPLRDPNTGISFMNQLRPPQNLREFIDARQGLRQLIENEKVGTPLRARLEALRSDLSDEVGATNPDWQTANDIWRDGKAGKEALDAGAAMSLRTNSASRQNLQVFQQAQDDADDARSALGAAKSALKANTDPAQQPPLQNVLDGAQARLDAALTKQNLFKVGLVRALNDRVIANKGETYDLTREMLLPGAQKMFTAVLGKDAPRFLRALQAEAQMHRTYASQSGSQTTPLAEAIDELNWAPQFHASWYSPWSWATKLLDLAHQYAARTINSNRNSQLMGLYNEENPLRQLDILRQAQALHSARSNAGNLVGRPAVNAMGPGINAFLGQEPKPDRQVTVMPPYQGGP